MAKCIIHADDGSIREASSFVAVLDDEEVEGLVEMLGTADVVTLGQALKMIEYEFLRELDKLSLNDRREVCEALQMEEYLP